MKDLTILENIKSFFKVGNINISKNSVSYVVTSISDLQVIISHFDKYPLISKKFADFILFKQAFELVKNKEHLTIPCGIPIRDPLGSPKGIEGLEKLVSIRASMNFNLTDNLNYNFTSVVPANRVEVLSPNSIFPQWIAGFTAAEGCFSIKLWNSKAYGTGVGIKLAFTLTQHIRDTELLRCIIKELDCGRIVSRSDVSTVELEVNKLSDIIGIIIPLFSKYALQGIKVNDFNDFEKVANLMENKSHLTLQGVEEIKLIKLGMNKGR